MGAAKRSPTATVEANVIRKTMASFSALSIAGYAMLGASLLWAVHNCVFILQHYFRLPYWDYWDWLRSYYGGGLWHAMTTQQNEHRLFFPSLAYALDQEVGRGLNHLLILMTLATQLLTFFIVWLPLRDARAIPKGVAAFMGGATAVFATWFLQGHNLFSPFQFCSVLSACLCVGAFYCLARASVEYRLIYSVAAFGCAFIATFSFANGLFAWPLLIAICLLRKTWRFVLIYTLGFVISLGLYLNGYIRPGHHADPASSLLHKPISVIYYLLIFLGRPFIAPTDTDISREAAMMAAAIGLAGLLLCAGLVFFYVIRSKHELEEHLYIPLMLWAASTGFVTALGRINFPLNEVLSYRYVGIEILFWYSLVTTLLLLVIRRRVFWPLLPAEIMGLIAVACLSTYPSHRVAGESLATKRAILDQEASALFAGVFDSDQWINNVFPAVPVPAIAALRRLHRGPFAFKEAGIVGKNVATLRQGRGCQGFIDSMAVTSDRHGVRLVGWAWGADNRQADLIALADSNGNIIGWGITGSPRPDVVKVFNDPARAHAGWAGYAPTLGPVWAFVLSNDWETACYLPGGH